MRKKTTGTRLSKEAEVKTGPSPYTAPSRDYVKCPACGAKIAWEPSKESDKGWIPCDPQLRIVVFLIPDNDIRKVPDEQQVKGIEIGSGKCVWGRTLDDRERKYYKKHKTLDRLVPWCMARVSHFETCERCDLWLNGTAKYPAATTECGDGGSTPATEDGSQETNDEKSDAEFCLEVQDADHETTS